MRHVADAAVVQLSWRCILVGWAGAAHLDKPVRLPAVGIAHEPAHSAAQGDHHRHPARRRGALALCCALLALLSDIRYISVRCSADNTMRAEAFKCGIVSSVLSSVTVFLAARHPWGLDTPASLRGRCDHCPGGWCTCLHRHVNDLHAELPDARLGLCAPCLCEPF